jgi:hypothetical protein
MRALNKKVITGVAAAAIVLGGSGVAYAYWGTTGKASGEAATTDGAANLTVLHNATLAPMYPGDKPQDITGTIKNNAKNSAYVREVAISMQVVGGAGCDTSDYTLSSNSLPVNKDIASGQTIEWKGATIQFNNKPDENQDGCKNATVYLNFVAS